MNWESLWNKSITEWQTCSEGYVVGSPAWSSWGIYDCAFLSGFPPKCQLQFVAICFEEVYEVSWQQDLCRWNTLAYISFDGYWQLLMVIGCQFPVSPCKSNLYHSTEVGTKGRFLARLTGAEHVRKIQQEFWLETWPPRMGNHQCLEKYPGQAAWCSWHGTAMRHAPCASHAPAMRRGPSKCIPSLWWMRGQLRRRICVSSRRSKIWKKADGCSVGKGNPDREWCVVIVFSFFSFWVKSPFWIILVS